MNYAMVLSGGVGKRLKEIDMPKQYYLVNGRTVLSYCIEAIERCMDIDGYIIVTAEGWREHVQLELKRLSQSDSIFGAKFMGFASPGENRQLSIYHGLCVLSKSANENDLVLIQDAARPNTSSALFNRCFKISDDVDGAMPVLPMKDTLYLSRDGSSVDGLLNRAEIFAGQAPEVFRFGKYLRANELLLPEEILKINGSTEPAVKAGMKMMLVDGEESNFKITTIEDLRRFEQMMEDKNQ